MNEGVDAERRAIAGRAGALRLDMCETWPPNQRAVAKNPKIAHIAEPDRKRVVAPHRSRCFLSPSYLLSLETSLPRRQHPCVNESRSMTSSDELQPNRSRRLWWLVAFIAVLFGIYSAGWFYLANKVRNDADKAVETLKSQGIVAGCSNLTVSGYPLSFIISCDTLGYQDDARNIAASAGNFSAVAQITQPLSPVADLRGPLRTS